MSMSSSTKRTGRYRQVDREEGREGRQEGKVASVKGGDDGDGEANIQPALLERDSGHAFIPKPTVEAATTMESGNDSNSDDYDNDNDDYESRQKQTSNIDCERHDRRLAVFLYAACTMLLFADQNLLAPNLTAAAREFGFTDDERDRKLGGDIALAFFVLGAPASFVLGCLADVVPSRSALFATAVLVGEFGCLGTYASRTYRQLYVSRALTGVSVGGALPLVASVAADWYGPDERSAVMAAVGIGTGAPIALGQGLAGVLGPRYGWRSPFLVVSAPALLCALCVLGMVRDPARGAMDRESALAVVAEAFLETKSAATPASIELSSVRDCGPARFHSSRRIVGSDEDCEFNGCGDECGEAVCRGDEIECPAASADDVQSSGDGSHGVASHMSFACKSCTSHMRALLSLLRCPTVLLALLQGAPGCIPWGIVNTFLNDYLSEDRGMTVEGATLVVTTFGFGNFLGMLVGGAGGSYLYSVDPRFPSLLSGAAAVLGCFPMWILLSTVDSSSPVPYVLAVSVIAGLGSGITGPIVKATLQNVTLPESRGRAFAFLNTFDDFGRGLGPVLVSSMIVSMGGRTPAFKAGVLGWVLCGVLNACMFFTVATDERRMRRELAVLERTRRGGGGGSDSGGIVVRMGPASTFARGGLASESLSEVAHRRVADEVPLL